MIYMTKKQQQWLKLSLTLMVWGIPGLIVAQEKRDEAALKGPQLTLLHQAPVGAIQNQGATGTCWCFATTSMIQSEIIRLGKDPVELSEMFTVRNIYSEKADTYVRFHGTCNFDQGGAQHDVMSSLKKYGMVPREVYPGLNYGSEIHNHSEIANVLTGMVSNVIRNRNGQLSPVWKKGFNQVLDAYFGEKPGSFTYQGKSYTPQSFLETCGINPDDYIEFSSFTHHPFYEKFVLEVPDNWAQKSMYNVPIDDLIEIIRNALTHEISISWAADITGLNFNEGLALIPEEGEDPKNPFAAEKTVSQEDRQYLFDHYQLTDDHAMHLMGIAQDQNGKIYFMEKNSWGPGGTYQGFSYLSESFLRMRTMSILVHKDAVPERIAKKIGLQ